MQNFNKQTDDQLVAAYAKGNNEAFDVLLQRHQSRVFNYIFQIVKDRDLTEDIFQETFVKAITTIRQGRYTETGKFSAWINRIARNLVIDFFRQEKAEAAVSADDENFDVLNRKELSEDTVEDLMIDNQIRADLRRLIKHLPASQRQVLVMRYYRNLSFKEIAEATGVSINTALGRMRYALLNIRRIANENAIALTR
ncbi:MAG: sigma-70 family RNA polymerase sigma factor [Muribaculaceae bacterium]|nr:sigma-70 family RNA polymerase sigma factor [Muribaculaceae bacterium]